MKSFKTIDAYIADFPKNTQKLLKQLRATIKKAAPNAEEAISYGIPTFKLNGNLVHFGGFKKHVSFFPGPQAIKAFASKLRSYEQSKGTVQFSLDETLPLDVIGDIVKFRVGQQEMKKNKKK